MVWLKTRVVKMIQRVWIKVYMSLRLNKFLSKNFQIVNFYWFSKTSPVNKRSTQNRLQWKIQRIPQRIFHRSQHRHPLTITRAGDPKINIWHSHANVSHGIDDLVHGSLVYNIDFIFHSKVQIIIFNAPSIVLISLSELDLVWLISDLARLYIGILADISSSRVSPKFKDIWPSFNKNKAI